ncbi:MAG: TolC family protein [Deltaproteobacteria bacterium]|nr:TolC family protein [Deltaproteobacteria bacterium]
MFFKKNFFLAWFFILPFLSFADTQNLTWDQCVDLALKNNPSLKAKEHEVKSSGFGITKARAGYFPDLTLSGTLKRFEDTSSTSTTGVNTSQTYTSKATLEIFSGFETVASVHEAEATLHKSESSLSQIKVNLLADLRTTFSEALYAQENIILSEKIEKRLKKNASFLKLRYEGGLEARWAYQKAQADWKEALWEAEKAQQELKVTQKKLFKVLGLASHSVITRVSSKPVVISSLRDGIASASPRNDGGDDMDVNFRVSGDFTVPKLVTLENLRNTVLQNHSSLAFQYFQRELTRATIEKEESDFWPTVSLFADYSIKGTNSNPNKKAWSYGLEFSWALFSGLETYAATRAAKENYAKEDFTLQNTVLSIDSDLKETYTNYKFAKEKVEIKKSQLEAALERAAVVEEEYSSGLKNFLDWEQSQSILTQTERQYLVAQRDALNALASFEKAQGKELSRK